MADHSPVPGPFGSFHGVESLRKRADLIHLDENGVADTLLDASAKNVLVGDEDVVPNELGPGTQEVGVGLPPVPVILGETIFDRHQREVVQQLGQEGGHLIGAEFATLSRQHVLATPVQL